MTTVVEITPRADALSPRRSGLDLSGPILILVAAVLCVLVIMPLGWIAIYSFKDKAGGATFANFATLFGDASFLEPLLSTLDIAAWVSAACVSVAAPMAWLCARTDMPAARTIRLLVTASFVTPPFLGAIAWELLAAPNSGLLNKLYRSATQAQSDEYLVNIYSLPGLIFVISCYTYPYVFVLLCNALDRIPGDLEDASSILGGSASLTARKVTLPLVLPALLAGGLVAILQAMTLFGSPAILALPAGFHTLTTKIWSLFQFPPKPELAAAASLPLLFVTVLLLRAQSAILGRRSYAVLGGRNSEPRLIRLTWMRWPALLGCLFMLLFPVFLPYGVLLNAVFSANPSELVGFDNFTLHNLYFAFFELSATRLAFSNTAFLAIGAATIGTGLSLIIAYLTARKAVPGHQLLGFIATAPIAIPGIVLGVGLFLSYTRPPLLLYGTLWILLIAFVTIEMPQAYQQLQAAFRSVHPELEEASRILGASRLKALWSITAPLLRSSVVATWCFIFVAVVRELSAAIILFTSETKTISVLIFDLKESGDFSAIAVLGLAMLVLTAGVLVLANRLSVERSTASLRST